MKFRARLFAEWALAHSKQPSAGLDCALRFCLPLSNKIRTMDGYEYRFIIDVFKPNTIPMARLAEYMADLARLLGSEAHVHFDRLEESSLALVQTIEPAAYPAVQSRIRSLDAGTPDEALRKDYEALDLKLQKDKARAKLLPPNSALIIEFPGRDRPQPVTYGPFAEEGTLQGQLISIRGKDATKHLIIQDGPVSYSNLETSEEMARELRHHTFDYVRVNGTGRWLRLEDGTWKLQAFNVRSFEILSDEPLADVIAKLRKVSGNRWADSVNPISELLNLRGDDEQVH